MPRLLTSFRGFEPPEHVPRTSARALRLHRSVDADPLRASQPSAREKTRGWKSENCRCAKKINLVHSSIDMVCQLPATRTSYTVVDSGRQRELGSLSDGLCIGRFGVSRPPNKCLILITATW